MRSYCVTFSCFDALEPRRLFAVDLAANFAYGGFDPKTSKVNCAATITNVGDAAPPTSYKIRWFLSRDQVVNNSDDIALLEATVGSAPAPNKSVERFDSPVVPYSAPDGPYYVGFAVDVDNAISEESDANNYQFTAIAALFIDSQPVFAVGTARDDSVLVSSGADPQGRQQIVVKVNAQEVARVNPFRARVIQIRTGEGNDNVLITDEINNPIFVDGGLGTLR